jgi:hypothetical protein
MTPSEGRTAADKVLSDFAWRYVNDERMDDATFRSLVKHHPAITDQPEPASALPPDMSANAGAPLGSDLAASIRANLADGWVAVPRRAKHWPFVETPGEFTDRLVEALKHSISPLAAVRTVLIEEPPEIAASSPAKEELGGGALPLADQYLFEGFTPPKKQVAEPSPPEKPFAYGRFSGGPRDCEFNLFYAHPDYKPQPDDVLLYTHPAPSVVEALTTAQEIIRGFHQRYGGYSLALAKIDAALQAKGEGL